MLIDKFAAKIQMVGQKHRRNKRSDSDFDM